MLANSSPRPSIDSRRLAGPRAGFTLVELVIVVAIIGILAAIITPAVMRSFGAARDAKVKVEITQLASAVTAFKATFGVEPPSRIVLFEGAADGADSGGNDWDDYTTYSVGGEAKRSRAWIKRLWTRFDFSAARDLNGDGDSTDVYQLNGAECLAFFLGGPCIQVGGRLAPQGFSKNPQNPFAPPLTTGESREGPFFEFDSARLTNVTGGYFPEYLDSLPDQTVPYVYFSSYDGQGYDAADGISINSVTLNPYYSVTEDTNLNGTLDTGEDRITSPASTISVIEYFNPRSFQIISAGVDNMHGTGGFFDPARPQVSLKYGRPATSAANSPQAEYDNITNFNAGRLFNR